MKEELQEISPETQTEDHDRKSIYVGNVDYSTSSEELRGLFSPCGAIIRVTIPTNRYKHPKGYAYIEFTTKESAVAARTFNNQVFKGRKLKVFPKRTNIPGRSKVYRRGTSRGPRHFRNTRFW